MKKTILLFLYISFIFLGCSNNSDPFGKYDMNRFEYKGKEVIIVMPQKPLEGKPWIWRPAFFGAFPSVDEALLAKGFYVVYYDLTNHYGSPKAVEMGTDFYNYMIEQYHFSPKVTLEGFSRGGLFVFNWADKNSDKVACIYVDAPVCNVFSWPGRKDKELWTELLSEWQLTDSEMDHFEGNPIDNLDNIAESNVPVIAVCGDSDDTVPYEENMGIVYTRYKALGGKVEVILKKGVGHHPHSLHNPKPVVDFIIHNQ